MATNNQLNVGLSGSSGTGSFAGTTSPSFTTPILGTPTSGNLSNCTSIPVAQATGLLPLANGGLNANLTASNGGIFYSTASAGAILSGTATAGQLLTSGASTTPAWSTSTYPLTNAVNTLLYASSANVMAALATANSSVLVTSSGGIPSLSTALPASLTATNMSLTTPTLGAATATSIAFSPTTGGIIGTAVADNAGAGFVGQVISSNIPFASATALTTATAKNVTSISLTAGDWDVFGNITIAPSVAASAAYAWTSTTSAAIPDQSLYAVVGVAAQSVAGITVPLLRVNVNGTTTVYLTAYAVFASGTCSASGTIFARRMR